MRAQESVNFEGIDATPAPFFLNGGRYAIAAVGTWGDDGAATLELIALGTTFPTMPPIEEDGYTVVEIPPGQYQMTLADVTDGSVLIVRIPGE